VNDLVGRSRVCYFSRIGLQALDYVIGSGGPSVVLRNSPSANEGENIII